VIYIGIYSIPSFIRVSIILLWSVTHTCMEPNRLYTFKLHIMSLAMTCYALGGFEPRKLSEDDEWRSWTGTTSTYNSEKERKEVEGTVQLFT